MRKTISVVVPVFNEVENVQTALESLEALFAEKLPNYALEVLFTDNDSTDGTWEKIRLLARGKPNVKGFRFSRNYGYQNSIFAGLTLAKGEAVVELDADLEDPPELIVEFVQKWEEGFDLIYGVRRKRREPAWLKGAFALFYYLLDKAAEVSLPRQAGDCRLIDRRMLKVLIGLPERDLYLRGLTVLLGFKQFAVPYDRNLRQAGESKFRVSSYVSFAVSAVTSFTKAPLRLIGWFGAGLFGLLSMGALIYLGGAFWRGELPDFKVLILLFSLVLHAMTFIFLGILGEYLGRVFDGVKGRPRAIVRESTDPELVLPIVI